MFLSLFRERTVEEMARYELDKALRNQLLYASAIEDYTATQSANNVRINRLRKYILELEAQRDKDKQDKQDNPARIEMAQQDPSRVQD